MSEKQSAPVLGLSGTVAAGKSTVGRILASLRRSCLIDADKLAHTAYAPGSDLAQILAAHFGDNILCEDGKTVDRRALGKVVFGDKDKLGELNELVWPRIRELVIAEIDAAKGREAEDVVDLIILDAAILVEAQWDDLCDFVLLVEADRSTCLERLARRNPELSLEDVEKRYGAHDSADRRYERLQARNAKCAILKNNGTLEELTKAAESIAKSLCG